MDLQDLVRMAAQILDEERIKQTVHYEKSKTTPVTAVASPFEGGQYPQRVRENPEEFQLKSANFDLLCTLFDQVQEQDRPFLFEYLRSRILDAVSYRHNAGPVLGAGSWARCGSELPLIAEFLVRRGDKQLFIKALSDAAPGPGLTLLMMQLEKMIAFNFTLFTDAEYTRMPTAIASVRKAIADLVRRPRPGSAIESNTVHHVCREIPGLCDRVLEACRKAQFFYVKSSLLPEMNLEVNQDKDKVRTFLEKLGFTQLLIEALQEAERLYRADSSPFELKSSMGHLRSFLEKLHLEACAAVHRKYGGALPSSWGNASLYLRTNNILTLQEEKIATALYTLVSDAAVHPLVAEREYARLIRNITIEYGLLLLTKLDKLGLNYT